MYLQRFEITRAGRDALQPVLAQQAAALTAADPAQLTTLLGPMLSPPDRAILETDVAAFIVAAIRDGLAAGVDGWVDDELAFIAPWGVQLGSIRAPVALWHGEQDLRIPSTHGRWLAAAIPGAALRVLPDDGHFSPVFQWTRQVVDWLAGKLHQDG